jgi:hypothetical protein
MGSVTDVDRLFSVPLEDFVAERKQVAKELRDAGERDAAAEVAKMPKPTPPAWALNQLAREEPDAVGAWLDAAEELRDVSANPGAGLREAMAAHRDATRTLLGVVRDRARPGGKPLSEPMLERARALLQAATVDASVGEALRAGRVVEGDEQPTFGSAPEGDEAPARTAAGKGGKGAGGGSSRAARSRGPSKADERRAAKEREAEQQAKERADRLAELEKHIQAAEEELTRLRDEAAERNAAVGAADERLEDARRVLNRTESEAAAAHDAADEANAAVATAERDLRQLTRQFRSASS